MILAPDRSKLSKRHGATSVLEYRQMGYLPSAMVNFLALMGWSLDDKTDLFSAGDLVRHFSIGRVARSGAVFNLEKLKSLNGHYTRQLTHEELTDALLDYWRRYPPEEVEALPDRDLLLRIVPLIQERLKTLKDAAPLVAFFFRPDVEYQTQELVQKGMDAAGARLALKGALEALSEVDAFDADAIEGVLRPLAEDLGLKVGQLLGSLRVATTGLRVSPPLFETLEVLGKDRSLTAIGEALTRLEHIIH
jgi:glutamyl-tRNA synthetase